MNRLFETLFTMNAEQTDGVKSLIKDSGTFQLLFA